MAKTNKLCRYRATDLRLYFFSLCQKQVFSCLSHFNIILHAIIGLISVKFNGSCKLMKLYVDQYTLSQLMVCHYILFDAEIKATSWRKCHVDFCSIFPIMFYVKAVNGWLCIIILCCP